MLCIVLFANLGLVVRLHAFFLLFMFMVEVPRLLDALDLTRDQEIDAIDGLSLLEKQSISGGLIYFKGVRIKEESIQTLEFALRYSFEKVKLVDQIDLAVRFLTLLFKEHSMKVVFGQDCSNDLLADSLTCSISSVFLLG